VRWIVHGERPVYRSEWVELTLAEVELPSGARYEHHLVKLPPAVAVAVVGDDASSVLMLWRHRFTTDSWGWELPAGAVGDGESLAQAAARETEEETGWRPHGLSELAYIQPISGITNAEQHVFRADGATFVSPPVDSFESDHIAWVPLAGVPELIAQRKIVSAATVVGLLQLLAADHLGELG
jgi:8-oxo-dGTP pyrophosphatase MutT (NUDIX family)